MWPPLQFLKFGAAQAATFTFDRLTRPFHARYDHAIAMAELHRQPPAWIQHGNQHHSRHSLSDPIG